jgi:hypothetical protein
MRRILFALLMILAWAGYAEAQGTIFNLSPPAPNAQLRVCPSPDNGYPCPVTAAIFSDVGLTQSIAQPIQLGPSGFATFYIASGTYVIQLSGPGYNSANRQTVSIGGSGSGITSVSSLPATCTPGTTAPVQLSVIPFGIYICTATNTWTVDSSIGFSLSPLSFGAKWDVKSNSAATFVQNSNTVTCPDASCGFTSADLGKIVFGTTAPDSMTVGCNGASCGSVILPQGFICTINSANSISVGTTFPGCAVDNATASCTQAGGHICALVWGTQDDSTAIQNTAIAAWAGTTCKTVVFPSGQAFITIPSGGLLNVGTVPTGSPCAGVALADDTQVGPSVAGQGMGNSILVPLPSTNFANCTGGQSLAGCIVGPANWYAHDWGVWGYGQSDAGTTHAVNLIEFEGVNPNCTAMAAWNMSFSMWEAASASSTGLLGKGGCGVTYFSNIVTEGFGNTNCRFASGNILTLNALDCFGSDGAAGGGGASLWLDLNGNIVNSTGGMYWGVNASGAGNVPAVRLESNGTWNSFSDYLIGASNGNATFGIFFNNNGTATVNLSGTKITESNSSGTGNSSLFFCGANPTNCNINAYSATLSAIGTKMSMFTKTSGTINFTDACANTFTQGSIANSAINTFGSCSVTGTPITAAKLVLSSGWGNTPTAAWTALTGATQSVQGTITNGTVGLTANPTITYTFPTPFIQAPAFCSAYQVGGTQPILAASEFLTPTALTNTGVVFTFNNTPGASNTEIIQILCTNQ